MGRKSSNGGSGHACVKPISTATGSRAGRSAPGRLCTGSRRAGLGTRLIAITDRQKKAALTEGTTWNRPESHVRRFGRTRAGAVWFRVGGAPHKPRPVWARGGTSFPGPGPGRAAPRALLFSPWCGNKCVTHCNHDHPSLARQRIETCAPGLDHFWLGRRTGIAGMGATASVGLLRRERGWEIAAGTCRVTC